MVPYADAKEWEMVGVGGWRMKNRRIWRDRKRVRSVPSGLQGTYERVKLQGSAGVG